MYSHNTPYSYEERDQTKTLFFFFYILHPWQENKKLKKTRTILQLKKECSCHVCKFICFFWFGPNFSSRFSTVGHTEWVSRNKSDQIYSSKDREGVRRGSAWLEWGVKGSTQIRVKHLGVLRTGTRYSKHNSLWYICCTQRQAGLTSFLIIFFHLGCIDLQAQYGLILVMRMCCGGEGALTL